tara:strand:+ start:18558 stop:18905 length:348 start_codon:yes stop_codon:yes gene_type:complete
MAIRFSEEPCPKSAKGRPCIIKFFKTQLVGEGQRKTMYRCRRCKEIEVVTEDATQLECPLSSNGKHQWKWVENVAFQQHYKYQEKTDREKCSLCKCEQLRSYKSLVGYNPHRKRR